MVTNTLKGDPVSLTTWKRDRVIQPKTKPGSAAAKVDQPPRVATPPPALAPSLSVDAAVACAASLVARGDTTGAARVVSDALAAAPAGNAGWLVPIEPLLGVQRAHAAWAPVLAALRTRSV